MTGRGRGRCGGSIRAGFFKRIGFGSGFGFGRGRFGRCAFPVPGRGESLPADEKEYLLMRKEYLVSQMDALSKRIDELEAQK
jgi:hypothetical protein